MALEEKNKIIVISDCYRSATATSNRLLAILKGLDSFGIKIEMTFVYVSSNGDYVDDTQYNNVVFQYLLDSSSILCRNRILKFLQSFFYLKKYIKCIPEKTKVILMDGGLYLPIILRGKKLTVYAERTEHPSITMMPSWINSFFMKKYEKTEGLFVISTALKDYYANRGVKRIEIINMVVDDSRFNAVKKSESRDKYVAYCGTVTNTKDGVDDLIRSFAIVKATHPEYKLYIIGPVPSVDERNGNIKLIKDLELEESVVLTGVVSRDVLPQLLYDSEVLVLARPDNLQAKFGFPTKLGEYLMTGNPVVVTRVGDIPLFLKDKESALLATPGDCSEMASKINWAIEHPEESVRIGEMGKKVALECFNNIIESKKILNMILEDK